MTERRQRLLAGAAVVAVVIAVYADSLRGPFVFLDVPAIVDNPTLRHLWPLSTVLHPPDAGGLTVGGRPIVNLSLALNFAAGGLQVIGYHLANLAIHAACALLLLGIARRSLGLGAATIAALLWAAHPLDTEAVTWIVQRAESLMALFYLGTLYCFIRYTERPRWGVLAFLACLLGMGTKEVMVSAPVLVLLYDRRPRRHWRMHAALFATWLPLAVLVARGGGRGGTAGFGLGFSWGRYVLTECRVVWTYLRLAVWPHPLDFNYTYRLASGFSAAVLATPLLLILAAAAYFLPGQVEAAFRRWIRPGPPREAAIPAVKAAGYGGLWFFAILAPTALVPGGTQTIAEHRMYLALVPLAAGAAWLMWKALGRRSWFVAAPLVAVLAAATAARNRVYASDYSLWRDTVRRSPDNPFAQDNFGVAAVGRGEDAQAIRAFTTALALKPNYAEAANNLGQAEAHAGRLEEALAHFRLALRVRPDYPEARTNLGVALARAGRPAEAIAAFQAVLRSHPRYVEARNDLAVVEAETGRFAEAIADYRLALRQGPDSAETRYNLGNALLAAGRPAEAIGEYRRSLRLQRGNADAAANLGAALAQTGQTEAAVAAYRDALRLAPGDPDIHYNLGLALRQLGQADAAEAELARAAQLRSGRQ